MSHYTCLVIGDNPESQLASYQENNMGDCPKHLLKFKDTEQEHLDDYASKSTSCFVSPEGKPFCKYDSQFRNPNYTFKFTDNDRGQEFLCPVGWTEKEVPVKEVYPTFEVYMKEYCGSSKRDEETGRFGYWENPNAKWDWYELGGRWSGFFTDRDGEKVDTELVENIDFEAKLNEKRAYALRLYDYLWEYIKDTPKIQSWTTIRLDEKDKGEEGHIERTREIYNAQPRMVAIEAMQKILRGRSKTVKETEVESHLRWIDDVEDFNLPREVYAQNYAERSLQTFAVVKDGRWFERGKMGWWACVSNEKDMETWQSIYKNLLKDLPKGTRLSLYDCHI